MYALLAGGLATLPGVSKSPRTCSAGSRTGRTDLGRDRRAHRPPAFPVGREGRIMGRSAKVSPRASGQAMGGHGSAPGTENRADSVAGPRTAGEEPAADASAGEPIRTLIVDDHALFRRGLEMVLESEPGIELVGEAGDGEEAVRV